MELTTRLLQLGGLALPRGNLVAYIKNAYPYVDRIGKHDGPAQLRQFAEVTAETVTLYHPSITGSETITSHGGAASVSVIVGGIVIGIGTCWEIRDSAGHHWSHCAALSATSVVMWDVSGLGDHLIAAGLDATVVTELCSSGREFGSDWLDGRGWSTADNGNSLLSETHAVMVPANTLIPAIQYSSFACSYLSPVPIQDILTDGISPILYNLEYIQTQVVLI